jgi:hypothetical protein
MGTTKRLAKKISWSAFALGLVVGQLILWALGFYK